MNYEEAATRLRPAAEEAFEAYSTLVAANREQIERLRDTPPPIADFWARRAPRFRPGVLDADELSRLIELSKPDDVWLDIGAGGGRFAIPMSGYVHTVVAVEPSPSMRDVLADAARAEGRTNIEVVDLNWPPEPGAEAPIGDVSLVANVLYDVPDIEAFLTALETHSRRLCTAIVSDRAPSTPDSAVWEALHGEPLHALPALPELVAVLGALGRRYEVRTFPVPSPSPVDIEEAMSEQRWRYWTEAGTEKDALLRELLIGHFGLPSGEVWLPARRNYSAVVTWPPPISR